MAPTAFVHGSQLPSEYWQCQPAQVESTGARAQPGCARLVPPVQHPEAVAGATVALCSTRLLCYSAAKGASGMVLPPSGQPTTTVICPPPTPNPHPSQCECWGYRLLSSSMPPLASHTATTSHDAWTSDGWENCQAPNPVATARGPRGGSFVRPLCPPPIPLFHRRAVRWEERRAPRDRRQDAPPERRGVHLQQRAAVRSGS
jgi:hypothetical protein